MAVSSAAADARLLGASRAGDPDAFGAFYTRYREQVLAFLMRRVRDPELAADLMAEAFASVLVGVRDPGRPLPAEPAAWLFTIARNLLIDAGRRGRVEASARRELGLAPLVLDDGDLSRIVEIAEAVDVARDLREVLAPHEWDLVRARVLDEETYPEIAARLRCSEAVARKRMSRAMAQLRTAIGGSSA